MLNIDLSNKIALVTGASGELGRVITRTLAQCGASVAINYLNSQAKAEALLAEVKNMGARAMTVKADVTQADDVFAMQREVARTLGDPDIIVNNAVIQYQWVNVLDQAVEDYESQFRSCVLHNVLMAKAFVPAMKQKRWGRVIALNTECAMQNTPSQSAYVSGKRGMDGVLRVLAREIGEYQITVNQVAPGWMISDKYRGESDNPKIIAEKEAAIGYARNVPLHRRGYDQDIANAVAFLASDLAAFITGAYIPVSGGNVMPTI